MKLVVMVMMSVMLGACGSTPRVTDALGQWRSGRRAAAIETARGEVERFRVGNAIAQADIDARLVEIERYLSEEIPILLPEKTPIELPEDPMEPGPSVDRGIREDLASAGATRTLRAIRVVQKLAMHRFANDLFILIWRREPWTADGVLLKDDSKAMRSVAVKVAALRALEGMQR